MIIKKLLTYLSYLYFFACSVRVFWSGLLFRCNYIIAFKSDLHHTCVPLDSQAGAKTAADL